MAQAWVGCSGFHYKHWKGVFYPDKLAQSKWFDYYNNRFRTLELNVTFYRFPRLPALETWYQVSPDTFKFSVKAPKAITHFKQFIGTERMINDFYGTLREGLKDKLGCVLFQMPPRMAYKEAKLNQIIENLDPTFANVLEFRHETWWNAEVYYTLARHNITFCGISHPDLPEEVVQNTPIVYYRFHGVPNLYQSKYELKKLQEVADEIQANPMIDSSFIYFNNDIDGSAITNAIEMNNYMSKLQ